MLVEECSHLVGARSVEAIDVQVGSGKGPVAQRWPGGDLERLEPVALGPSGDLGE